MKRTQAEIFGIALFFVVIIIGILVYSQYKLLNPSTDVSEERLKKYEILSQGTLHTLLESSTGCYVERGKDSLRDVINYCMELSFGSTDPNLECSDKTVSACAYSLELLNSSLNNLFVDESLGEFPYLLTIDTPQSQSSLLANVTLTNFGTLNTSSGIVTQKNYLRQGYRRAPSGIKTWVTAQKNIRFELFLYTK